MTIASLAVTLPADLPAFEGHFPGQPLLPGVMLLSLVLEAALADPACAACLGPAPRLGAAKFLAPVLPGNTVHLHLHDESAGLRFEVMLGERVAASGRWDRAA
jgi:3-hydroxymyristoyl/3-hydroxydecanoyl-(acyl carrier protein) dehydratase